jgi:hypothetical protein
MFGVEARVVVAEAAVPVDEVVATECGDTALPHT